MAQPGGSHGLAEQLAQPARAGNALLTVLDRVRQAASISDLDGRFLYVNPAFASLWHMTCEDVVGRLLHEVVGPATQRDTFTQVTSRALQTGVQQDWQFTVDEHRFQARTYPLTTHSGEAWAALTLTDDVTASELADRDARRLAAVLSSVSLAVYSTDTQSVITSWNAGAQRLYGYPADEAVGASMTELLAGEGGQAAGQAFVTAAALGGIMRTETIHRRVDGLPLRVELNLAPIGEPPADGVSIVALDLTAQRVVERDRVMLEAAVNASSDLIFITDNDGAIVFANAGAARKLGYSQKEMLGLNITDLVPAGDLPANLQRFAALERDEPIPDADLRFKRRDGSLIEVSTSASTVHDSSGRIVGRIGINRDLSEQRSVARLIASQSRTLAEYAHLTSHDLQEPLRHIMLAADALRRGEDPEMREVIAQAADVLSSRIDALLKLSLITQQRRRERVALAELVADAIDQHRDELRQAEGIVCVGDLPELAVNPPLITELFGHLLANSCRFRGDGPARVTITSDRRDDEWHIRIEDRGTGIAPDHMERAFGMFQRLTSDSRAGVGLPLARRIAELHGGALSAADVQPEQGVAFCLTLAADDT